MVRYSGLAATYNASWLLESAAFCAVNCYGLISGWVGVKSAWKIERILELWLTVFFYSAGISLICALTGAAPVTRDNWVSSLLPVTWKTYWYFSGYAALFFLMPFLNRMVLVLSKAQRRLLMLVLFLVFSVSTTIPKAFSADFLELISGYSLIWLIVLYLFGACMRLDEPARIKHRRRVYLAGYLIMVLIAWGFKLVCERITRELFGKAMYARMLLTYTAPTIFLAGVCLVLAFAGLHLHAEAAVRIVRLLASTCFSVYLIHAQPVIWENVLNGAFSAFGHLAWWQVIWPVLLAAAGIYIVCTFIDLLRLKLFAMLDVPGRCRCLGQRVREKYSRYETSINTEENQ